MELHRIIFLLFIFIVAGEPVFGRKHNYRGFRPTKLFVFGDSYADTGNNPKTVASSWKSPYGVTFPGKPAGRYSDGRVLTDYVARFMGIKSPLPYQWRKYGGNKLRYGINFAYGGTGVFDTGNFQPNMTTQIDYLEALTKDKVYTQRDLQSSVVLISVSGNDYGAYRATGGTIQGMPGFISRVVNQTAINLKRILDMGVRRVLVNGLQPLGCLPQTTFLYAYQQCNETENLSVDYHNKLLHQAVATLNNQTDERSEIMILDFFSSFNAVLQHKGECPANLKFENPLKPCCEATTTDANCGSVDDNGKPLYTVCDDPDTAFFWDTVHPSQAGWRAVYLHLRTTLTEILF